MSDTKGHNLKTASKGGGRIGKNKGDEYLLFIELQLVIYKEIKFLYLNPILVPAKIFKPRSY